MRPRYVIEWPAGTRLTTEQATTVAAMWEAAVADPRRRPIHLEGGHVVEISPPPRRAVWVKNAQRRAQRVRA